MSFRLKGTAALTRFGSSSEANVVPPAASASPSRWTVIFRMEQPGSNTSYQERQTHGRPIQPCGYAPLSDGMTLLSEITASLMGVMISSHRADFTR